MFENLFKKEKPSFYEVAQQLLMDAEKYERAGDDQTSDALLELLANKLLYKSKSK